MKKLLLLLLLVPLWCYPQQNYTLSGYVRDASTGEELIGVNISISDLKTGTSTNVYGYYSISLPPGSYQVVYQYIGYENTVRQVDLSKKIRLDVRLTPSATTLEEVEITAEPQNRNVTDVQMSVTQLDAKELQKVPQLLGETDIIRTLTLLPGVTTVGEGSNGFNVRGGAADQNLILLDEAPVYNSSHLFGFFSIFNADAVKDVKLYKGGIPAEYGGRLSSVVDVRQKEGNSERFALTGGIGLLSSRLLIEGPLVDEKVSFMAAGRRSYADLFLGLSNDPDLNQNILYFYDFNAKVNWRIGQKDRLFLSGYFGRDVLGVNELFQFDWGNATSSLRWNHLFSDKLFSNFTFIYSDYTYTLGTPEGDLNFFSLTSNIRDFHLKGQFNYYINRTNKVDFGFEAIYYRFSPGKVTAEAIEVPIELQREYALEPSVYFSQELKLNLRFTLQYGLRYSSFYKIGPQTVRTYRDPDFPLQEEITETTEYGRGELIERFDGWEGFEPRISSIYMLTENSSVKMSYNRTRQYIHLISNTNSPTPVDLYRPSGNYIDPATVHQVAGGYFHNFLNNQYEASVELYYKTFDNLVDYRPGADLIFTEFIETEVLSGTGRAYGAEFLVRKRSGKLTGWFSYTLSRSERKVVSDRLRTPINNNDWYPSNYDKLHDISLVANYQITKKWDIGGSFVFQTGRPYTPPVSKFQYEQITVPIYTSRNNARIPSYHRLDISANYTPPRKENKRFYSSWSFGIYNLYARRNAYSIYFQPRSNDFNVQARTDYFTTQAVRLSIFGTAIPFVTWNFNF